MKRLAFLTLAGLFTAACQSDRIASPSNSNVATVDDALAASRDGREGFRLPPPWEPGLRVQTYNLYLGTNLSPLLQAVTAESAS